METTEHRGFKESMLWENRWQGWYITRDRDMVVRLNMSPMESLDPSKMLIDYRAYFIDSGKIDSSGIHCLGKDDTTGELHRCIAHLCEFSGMSFKMCDLQQGIFCDSLEEAYLRRNRNELERASDMIYRHF